ncbi:hypothetical protein D5086_026465 [Populus alba]|uniref:Uncharacterized protein n=1 Tax=Populus alba TaxID=43335 RepID=A0ACC4B213_POPAL
MAMAIDGTKFELDFSGYSSTTTTATTTPTISTENDHYHGCNWNDWSPMVDWEALSGPHDDFQDLIDSMMDDGALMNQSSRLTPDTSNSMSTSDTVFVDEETSYSNDFKGLRLVHLLVAAAEALTGLNKSGDLARVILVRLKELVSPNDGTNMERLAAYFTDALQAFQLLQDMSPYVKFGHFTANQAILEAVADDRRIHIVDYDIMEGIQWASLMQALVSRKDGPPTPHLRITALSRGGSSRRSIGTVQETGRRLVAFAASIGQPFSFHQCRLDSDETFRPSALKSARGEALVMNCMLHLPHFSYREPDSVASFLSGAKTLNPRLITMVEEEVGPIGDGGFVGRFMDSLHHYSAFYDSMEAGFPMQGRARALVERVILGPRISGSLARIYRARGEEVCPWGEWLAAGGFQPVKVSFANHCQAKLLLGVFNDGYRVEELASNRLVLGWKSRRLLSASIWTSPSEPGL